MNSGHPSLCRKEGLKYISPSFLREKGQGMSSCRGKVNDPDLTLNPSPQGEGLGAIQLTPTFDELRSPLSLWKEGYC